MYFLIVQLFHQPITKMPSYEDQSKRSAGSVPIRLAVCPFSPRISPVTDLNVLHPFISHCPQEILLQTVCTALEPDPAWSTWPFLINLHTGHSFVRLRRVRIPPQRNPLKPRGLGDSPGTLAGPTTAGFPGRRFTC